MLLLVQQAELARLGDCFIDEAGKFFELTEPDSDALFGRNRFAILASEKLPNIEEGYSLELFDLDDDKIALSVLEKLSDLDRLGEVHGRPVMMSSAAPNGDAASPRASRSKALRIVSTGTPCWSAIEQTTAESLAAASTSDPARPLPRKISAIRSLPGK
jgi:hypothetical protein